MHVRYLKIFFLFALVWVGMIATVNYVVDPAAVYQLINKEGFNKIKPKISKYRFIWKAAYLEKNKPEIVFLGNSRVETGIDLDSAYRLGLIPVERSAFNSAIPALSIYGAKRFVQQAILAGNVKELFIGVDYIQFRYLAMRGSEQQYLEHEGVFSVDAEGNSQPFHQWVVYSKTLLSVDALDASLQTLKKQRAEYLNLTDLGHNSNEDMVRNILASGSQKHYFLKEETRFIDDYIKAKNNTLGFDDGIEEFRKILVLTQEHHVKTTLFIAPTHVHLQYLDAHAGDAAYYYNWKRTLTALVDKMNVGSSQPVVLWDFSIPVPETEERLPEDKGIMQWYLDPSHFRRELGDRMLVRMLGNPNDTNDEFGVQLTSKNIEASIQEHQQRLLQWQQQDPDDYADFQARIEKRRELLGKKPDDKTINQND